MSQSVYGSNWHAATMVEHPQRPRLTFDLDIDVCVIGGGLAGLTAAREIARHGWSVVVLEGNRVGWAASGRNTGFVMPGYGERIERMVERIGADHAKELWALSEGGLEYVRRAIAENRMPGVEPVDGWLKVSKTDNGGELSARAEMLRSFGAEVEFWPAARVRAALPSKDYFSALYFPRAFSIHPLNYAFGLARAAEDAGVRIFEDTPALSLDPAGVRKRIVTHSARVRASYVVLAGNVHLGSLMPRVAATLMPVSTYVMVTEPLGPRLYKTLRYSGAVSDTERADNHYRIVNGDRLMWAGRMTTWQANPKLFARGLVADIKRTFPQLGDVAVSHLWSGMLGMSIHRMPQIGELEHGVWLASGFGGHGLNTTAMAGQLVARGIVEGDQTWRAFAPYELVWAGGLLGRAAMQAFYWGTRPALKIATGLARYREYAGLQKKAKQAARRAARERPRETAAPASGAGVARIPDVAGALRAGAEKVKAGLRRANILGRARKKRKGSFSRTEKGRQRSSER
jgi:glycine/D-amino acid oxidase-like deaminating enzyme